MLLDEIKELNKERSGDYGHPLPNFLRASLEWSIQDAPFLHNPINVAIKMDSFKTIREVANVKWDNYRDKVGYVNTIDLMCQLYCEIQKEKLIVGLYVREGNHFYLDNDYRFMTDEQKGMVVKKLKSLSFSEQYDLLIEVMNYLAEKKNTEVL